MAKPGSADPGFGVRGRVVLRGLGSADALAVQRDGKLLAVSGSAVVRLKGNGSLDRAFGRRGVAVVPRLGTFFFDAVAMGLQADGKVVLAGRTGPPARRSQRFAVVRFTRQGRVDGGFGQRGVILTDFGGREAEPQALAIAPDGGLLVAGRIFGPHDSNDNETSDLAVARYRGDGVLDPSFGSGGTVISDLRTQDLPGQLVLQGDGKLLLSAKTAHCTEFTTDCYGLVECGSLVKCAVVVLRYRRDGVLDQTFGNPPGGVLFGPASFQTFPWLLSQGSGRYSLFGARENATPYGAAQVRFDATGALDRRFGTVKISGPFLDAGVQAAVRQPDNRIAVLGVGDAPWFVLARLKPSGRLDHTFGLRGAVVSRPDERGASLLRQRDGKLVVGGSANGRMLLARYLR